MCDKRVTVLKKLTLKPPRPVQTVTPEPAVPLQPPGGAPHPIFRTRRSYNKVRVLQHTTYLTQRRRRLCNSLAGECAPQKATNPKFCEIDPQKNRCCWPWPAPISTIRVNAESQAVKR